MNLHTTWCQNKPTPARYTWSGSGALLLQKYWMLCSAPLRALGRVAAPTAVEMKAGRWR